MSDEQSTQRPGRLARALRRTVSTDVMVVGLGRFGASLAVTLEQSGRSVFGVDVAADRVAEIAPLLTQSAVANTSEAETLRQLGVEDFDTVIVAIGGDLEGSILTTAALTDLGIGRIWARAESDAHARILERVGAHHVFQPSRDMGVRIAHLVAGNLVEFVALDEGFSMAEMSAPTALTGRRLADLQVRARYGITVVCVKPVGGAFTYASPDTAVAPGDLLVVAGTNDAIEAFATLP